MGAKQPWDVSYTDCAALARTAGLRNAGDRVRAALANGIIEGDRRGATMWTMRANFDSWLESALAEDRADDQSMIRIDQARAMASAAGVKSAAVMNAIVAGEIEGCFKDNSGWFIPKAGFMAWIEFVRAELETPSEDGLLTVSEAAALAASYGLSGFRSEILADCIEGRMPGALKVGSAWQIPLASMKSWIDELNAAVNIAFHEKQEKSWWQSYGWLVLIGAAILLWCFVLRS